MLHKARIGAVIVVGALVVGGRPASTMAQPTPASSTCAQAKEKAIGLKFLKTLKCYSKAAKDGLDRDPAVNATLGTCISDVDADTTTAFNDADAVGGCATDANIFDLNADTIGDGLVGSILDQANKGFAVNSMTVGYRGLNGPGAPEFTSGPNAGIVPLVAPGAAASKCAKKELIYLAVLAKKLHFCEKTAVKKNIAHELNGACAQKAVDAYQKKFDKAVASGPDCIATADGATLAGYVFFLTNTIIPNIPRSNGCGNGLVTNGSGGTLNETCDDGNLENFDSCPADCKVDACTPTASPRSATLVISGADALNVAALTVELDYPEGKIDLPGSGFGVASIQDETFSSGFDSVDFDHALRIVVSNDVAFGQTNIANMDFVDCSAAIPPVPGDFTCTVKEAFGAGGTPDFTATTSCTVTIP
jgi:hypothetical protein